MPLRKKRPASQLESDDPLEFVALYCKRRNIAFEIGSSPVEKLCAKAAASAREEYKTFRNALHTREDAPDRRALSPAQKYTIRLHNNRKSASASKVFSEVLKREHAAHLASITPSQAATLQSRDRETSNLRTTIYQLEGALKAEKRRVHTLQKHNDHLLTKLAHANFTHAPVQEVVQPPTTTSLEHVPASTALHQRYVNSRASPPIASWPLSPVNIALPDSDVKDFHTGLTCTQSQDADEKAHAPKSSLPMSSSLPLALLNSQPASQNDIPFKSLNTDELGGPLPGSDFFNGSQNSSKGLP
ncbi:hypothetical protein BWQ96_01636 [Gracilariopsis chorda]|uniref:Uncharacterized protein n=1 Tax=Gracilariopsis chorda TaxID=448386 RepID=A0A2V3J396_9FLOR|nr:hypothetical protein BWQ96_01636 [Gracilariopsis chorda]|eukprot:PXF48467.1 hypothetical protein BWQ96_01636 [Gracilariopsis chorda]